MRPAAQGGDMQAARLILERVLSPIKAVEQALFLNLPDGTLTEQGRAVLLAVGTGELAPGQGAAFLGAIATPGPGLPRLTNCHAGQRIGAKKEWPAFRNASNSGRHMSLSWRSTGVSKA